MNLPRTRRGWAPLLLLALASGWAVPGAATERNGFPLDGARVPVGEIVEGGPPRDGIPAVDEPHWSPPEQAHWVAAPNPVLGVALREEAHTYPEHLIERHQVVNDRIGGQKVVVTYDPLAGAPRAYRSTVKGRTLHFGVAGLIFNHSFLLYDHETESLWVQFTGEAIAGPLAGARLTPLRIRRETFASWLTRYPRASVLDRPMPRKIDYRHSPFIRYITEDRAIFPVRAEDHRFHQKEMVLGVVVNGRARAYLGSLATAAGGSVEDEFQGRKIRLIYETNSATFRYDVPDDVEVAEAYWLAWKAFHPDTEVWHDPGSGSR